jgi:hypothetical protein
MPSKVLRQRSAGRLWATLVRSVAQARRSLSAFWPAPRAVSKVAEAS